MRSLLEAREPGRWRLLTVKHFVITFWRAAVCSVYPLYYPVCSLCSVWRGGSRAGWRPPSPASSSSRCPACCPASRSSSSRQAVQCVVVRPLYLLFVCLSIFTSYATADWGDGGRSDGVLPGGAAGAHHPTTGGGGAPGHRVGHPHLLLSFISPHMAGASGVKLYPG